MKTHAINANQFASTADEYRSRKAAAERLSVSIETLKRWEKTGRLRGYRVGPKLVRYKASDLEGLLK